jgi:hypothetical protein
MAMNARGSDQYVKVLFDLEQDEDGYPPAAAETLWAVRVGDGLFQIDNIPFFVHGIAVNDIVSAAPEEGVFRYKEVVQPSGHGTIRLIVSETSDVQAVRDLFRQLGCSSELSHLPRLIAVDVPPSVPLQELKKVLDAGQEQDRWGYEGACLPQA